LGMSLRATNSPRTLEKGTVELKGRIQEKAELVPLDQAVEEIHRRLSS